MQLDVGGTGNHIDDMWFWVTEMSSRARRGTIPGAGCRYHPRGRHHPRLGLGRGTQDIKEEMPQTHAAAGLA